MVEEILKTKAREINLFFFNQKCVDFLLKNVPQTYNTFLNFFDYLPKAPKTTDSQDKCNIFDLFCFLKKKRKKSSDHVFI